MITIENKKIYTGDGFYIGRPSPLGNPFPVDKHNSRSVVIEKYRGWLIERLKSINPTSKAFNILLEHYKKEGSLTLICWCAPLQCHGEVIRDLILERIKT
jgi:hypothetical protein